MVKFVKKIVVLFVAILLIATSGGFSLYENYCYCSNEYLRSIVIEPQKCSVSGDDLTSNPTQQQNESDCCGQTNVPPKQPKSCDDVEDCCSFEYVFLQTDKFYFNPDQQFKFNFIAFYSIVIETSDTQKSQNVYLLSVINEGLPPPIYGNDLLISLHQFKIALPLV